jgi:SAM-dependent methyltransferase
MNTRREPVAGNTPSSSKSSTVNVTIKSVLSRLLPKYTKRRLAAGMARTFLNQPWRLFQRLNCENILLHRQFARISARCCICGNTGALFFDMPDVKLRREHGIGVLRETLACRFCGSTNRQRTLAHVFITVVCEQLGCRGSTLDELVRQLSQLQIWDTDAFSPLSAVLRSAGRCVLSKYLPARAFGDELEAGVFNIDLQRVSFESDRFDIILSSDIMEHVRNDHAAHVEIFRCLKPGGAYIFTVPFSEDQARTRRLVDASTAHDIFLGKPHYHGDPLTGGILAYRIYGRDLMAELEAIGFGVRFLRIDLAAEGIFSGDCFIAMKPKKTGLAVASLP